VRRCRGWTSFDSGPVANNGLSPKPSVASHLRVEHLARGDGSPKGRDRLPAWGIRRARGATARPAKPDAPDEECCNQNSAEAPSSVDTSSRRDPGQVSSRVLILLALLHDFVPLLDDSHHALQGFARAATSSSLKHSSMRSLNRPFSCVKRADWAVFGKALSNCFSACK
jgi:hypothetical protein